ncbi:YdeI family protein [Cellulomonas sp. URHD0024]|uniref:YdeI/OmpD-associated family protein n=1 Tax=Cellulomonas sp. URHD0024 TaxID=1302620 RepID=UPI000412FADE|nr:YdeI/OmpD-associated family protein [Cellulomonas sp. URHD0024]
MKDDAEQVLIESPQEWRDWLAEHHATSPGIWLVMWRPPSGRPHVTYEEAIEEALCFGWIDGQAQTLDADRTMLWLTRRRPGSGWSLMSKQRVARVEADGRMTPVGRAVIDAAKADGSWSRYDDADSLVLPKDLVFAFAVRRGSRAQWESFSEAVRRGILRWIVDAKRDATRTARVEETANLAEQGIPAHQQVRR